MLKKISIVLGIIASALILAVTVGFSYAWYIGIEKDEINLSGASAGAYFYDGDGSETNPFKIADSRHMYNLVWLQNNGKLDKKYHFELWNPNDANGRNGVVDMTSTIIPPIGNDENPFIGVFNGNGNKITNLVVSTDYDLIKNGNVLSEQGYKFSNAVGLFGMTGSGSVVKNFILDNPVVEVCAIDGNYNTNGQKVAGLAIGYVENNAASIGIIGGTLANRRDDSYSTYNSILGGMSSTAQSNMNITGDSIGPSGDRDKGYFIPDILQAKVDNLSNFRSTSGSGFKNFHWLVADESNALQLGAFSVSTSRSDGGDSISSNVKTSFRYYPAPASTGVSVNDCTTDVIYGTNSDYVNIDFKNNIITDQNGVTDTSGKYSSVLANVKDENGRINQFNYAWTFKNSPDNRTTNKTVITESNEVVGTGAYNIYAASIKVAIAHASTASPAEIFVIVSASAERYFGIAKMYTPTDGQSISDINHSNFLSITEDVNFSKDEPDQAMYVPSGDVAVGCCFKVTEPGIYQLYTCKNSVKYHYLSVIGVTEGQESTGSYSEENLISGIDFITETTSIKQTEGLGQFDFVSTGGTYSYTKVKISYTSNMNGVVLYFKRENDTIASLLLLINPNTNGVNKAGSGTCTPEATNVELLITSTGVTSSSPYN